MAFSAKAYVLVLVQLWLLCACTGDAESPTSNTVAGSRTIAHPGDFQDNSSEFNLDNPPAISAKQSAKNDIKFTQLESDATVQKPHSLLEEVYWLQLSEGRQDLDQLKDLLEKLNLNGRDAVFALRDLLLLSDSSSPDEQELRQTFLELLLSFELPEVEGIAVQLLESEPIPMEIWLLGQYLEKTQPGMNTGAIRLIAEQALIEAQSDSQLPGEFLQLIGEVGNESTVSLLLELPIHMNAYSRVALALIEDGSGIALLEQDARPVKNGQMTYQGKLAIELLAQQAYRQPDAIDALLNIARKGRIPAELWSELAVIMAGQKKITLVASASGRVASSTIYRPGGNQTIFRVTTSPLEETFEQLDQRLIALEQLQELAPLAFKHHFFAAEDLLLQFRDRFSSALSGNESGDIANYIFRGWTLELGRTTT